ncbi:pilus assembly protein PilO [Mesobacillus sp. S13]|uniref:pilus assembly protein PilO n=1 Tax=Mesobacillus sp. S13 TaxID=2880221 RepID=UPI001CF26ED0|nr:pilus assembly protein PilO [Mesobacillus sp. S13]
MNLRFEKKNIMILAIAVSLSVLIYIGAYFVFINPLKDSLALKENQLKSEQQLSESFETRLAASKDDYQSTIELQKKLPVDPMVEQLVLDFEKAEVVSNSYITSMEFNQESSEAPTAQAGETQGTETVTGEAVEPLKMPEGIEKTAVTITVEADGYFELEKFIETLEKLKRLVMVDSISFSGPEEINSLSDEKSPIVMTLTINSYYLSGLDDLKEHNPKIETPAPANKRNPFPTFGDYSEENLEELEQSEADDTEGTDEN